MQSNRLGQIVLAKSINQLSQAEIDRLLALNLIDPNSDISRRRRAELAEAQLLAILLFEKIMIELELAFEESLKGKKKVSAHLLYLWRSQSNYFATLMLEARISAERRLFHMRELVEKKISTLLAIIEQKMEELDERIMALDRTVKFLQKIYQEQAINIVKNMTQAFDSLDIPYPYKQYVRDKLNIVWDGFAEGLIHPDDFPDHVRKMIDGSARLYVEKIEAEYPLSRRHYHADIASHQTTILKKMNEVMAEEEWRLDLMRDNLESQGIGLARRAAVNEGRDELVEHQKEAVALRELVGDDARFQGYVSVDIAITQMTEIANSLDELSKKIEGIQPEPFIAEDENIPGKIRLRDIDLRVSDNAFSMFHSSRLRTLNVPANDDKLAHATRPMDAKSSANDAVSHDAHENPSPSWVPMDYRAASLMEKPANDHVLTKSPAQKIKDLREKLAAKRMKAELALRAMDQPNHGNSHTGVNDGDMAFGF